MAIVTTDDKHYKNIADAIRGKIGKTDLFKPEQMADGVGEVYEKGKTDFGYKKSVSGTPLYSAKYLYIDDIHPNEKKLKLTLTSDTITDFSTIGINVANVDKKERVQDAEIRASQGFALDCISTLIETFNHDAEIGGLSIRLKGNTSLFKENELEIEKKKAEIEDLNSSEGENSNE